MSESVLELSREGPPGFAGAGNLGRLPAGLSTRYTPCFIHIFSEPGHRPLLFVSPNNLFKRAAIFTMPLDAVHDHSCTQDVHACDCGAGDSTPVCKTPHQKGKSTMRSKAGLQTNQVVEATPQEPGPRAGDLQVRPADLGSLFAKRPLILGEDANDYDELLSRVTAAAKPTDAIEALWIKDVVDLTWEAQRLRRLKASLLMKAGQQALTKLLSKSRSAGQANGGRGLTVPNLVSAYATGDPSAVAEVEQILKGGAEDADSLMAQALAEHLDDVERIDRLIAGADARRNRALSEIDRRRDALARRLRRAAEDIVEVQHS